MITSIYFTISESETCAKILRKVEQSGAVLPIVRVSSKPTLESKAELLAAGSGLQPGGIAVWKLRWTWMRAAK